MDNENKFCALDSLYNDIQSITVSLKAMNKRLDGLESDMPLIEAGDLVEVEDGNKFIVYSVRTKISI